MLAIRLPKQTAFLDSISESQKVECYMTKTVDRKTLMELVKDDEAPCVSVCLPVNRAAPGANGNRIQFKNLVKQAQEQLVAGGMRSSEAAKLLEPVSKLTDGDRLRQPKGDGLAVLRTPSKFHCIDLPYACEAAAISGSYLHVKPLVPLVANGGGRFFVLALAENNAMLYEGSRDSFDERASADLPAGLTEATPEAESGRPVQFHTQAALQPPGRPAVFHGHDTEAATGVERVMRYLREVDEAVCAALAEEKAPLVIAAVDDLAAKYATVNNYANFVREPIRGNPEHTGLDDLQRMAWAKVEPMLNAERDRAIERYEQAFSKGMGSNAAIKIVETGYQGKVDTLMVALDQQEWGKFDSATGRATGDKERTLNSEDLLNLAAVFALRHGATVYGFSANELPQEARAAAIFRR